MLNKSREEQIKKCFEETLIEFHCLKHNFNLLIETRQKLNRNTDNDDKNDSEEDKNFVYGEKKTEFDKLIVTDNVPGFANRSSDFSSFFTVSRNFEYSYVYIFHILYPNKSN